MHVEMRPVASLKPYESNPRHNDGAVEAVANSIKEFGFRQPIVVDSDDVVIVGHTRLKAAQKLGLAEVPVHVAKNLTPAQVKAYRLADSPADLSKASNPAKMAERIRFGMGGRRNCLCLAGFAILFPQENSESMVQTEDIFNEVCI